MSNYHPLRNTLLTLTLLTAAILLLACAKPAITPTPIPPAATSPAPTIAIASPTPAPEKKQATTQKDAGKTEDSEHPMAHDFTAKDLLTGEEFSLSDYRGKIVFLNFWGSWCPPCRAEMPAFEEIYKQYGDDVVIIGVGINDSEDNLITFANSIGVTYPIVWDQTSEIARNYRVRSLPTTYRIDRNGEIRGVAVGGLNQEQLVQAIEELLHK